MTCKHVIFGCVCLVVLRSIAWPWNTPTLEEDSRAVSYMAVSNNLWAVDDMKVFERFAKREGWKFETVMRMDGNDGKTREFGSVTDSVRIGKLLESGVMLYSRFPLRTAQREFVELSRDQMSRLMYDILKMYDHVEYYNDESCYDLATICKLVNLWYGFAKDDSLKNKYPDPKLILPTEVQLVRRIRN